MNVTVHEGLLLVMVAALTAAILPDSELLHE